MPRFKYVAYNQSGVRQSGSRESAQAELLRTELDNEGLLVVSVEPETDSSSLQLDLFSNKLTLNDIEFFTSELALLLNAGLRIERGLKILQQNVKKNVLKDLTSSLLKDLKQGQSLSQSLSDFGGFDNLYISLVKIAEETGELTETFQRLSDELKYQTALRSKIKQALVYPAVILTVCILAVVFIFNFVVPNLTSLFSDAENLPAYTVALLAVSDFFQAYQWHMLFVVMGAAAALYAYRDTDTVTGIITIVKEKMPVARSANLLVERIRFSSATATMLASGVAIDKALILAKSTISSNDLRSEVNAAIGSIKKGESLSQKLGETRLFPSYFASLLSIGEESGELEKVFNEISDRSRQQFYDWVTRFTNLLEPMLILFMGALVGSVVVIMMLSISAVTDMDL